MKIRRMTISDVDRVARLWQMMQQELSLPMILADDVEREEYLVALVETARNPNHGLVIVAESDEEIVGFLKAKLKPYRYGYRNSVISINDLYVIPEFRGTAIAGRLWLAFKKTLAGQSIEIDAPPDRVAFYERLGFKPVTVTMIRE